MPLSGNGESKLAVFTPLCRRPTSICFTCYVSQHPDAVGGNEKSSFNSNNIPSILIKILILMAVG